MGKVYGPCQDHDKKEYVTEVKREGVCDMCKECNDLYIVVRLRPKIQSRKDNLSRDEKAPMASLCVSGTKYKA